MGLTSESTIPDPRGTDRERALFLDLVWDDAIERQVQRRAEAEFEKMRSRLLSDIDDEKVRAIKFAVADVENRKRSFRSEGRYQGMALGIFGTLFTVLLVTLALHHH
jgi:hypothetical protein